MFCDKCGKELNSDSKFCPQCGTEVSNSSEIRHESDKRGFIEKITSAKVYYPAMVIMVICAIVFGRAELGKATKNDERIDLSQFVGKTEKYVAEYFDSGHNEYGMYPDEKNATVTCSDGYVSCINISKSDENSTRYLYHGVSLGDSKDVCRKQIEAFGYILRDEQEVPDGSMDIYADKDNYTLNIYYSEDGKVEQIYYLAENVEEMAQSELPEDVDMTYENIVDEPEKYNSETETKDDYVADKADNDFVHVAFDTSILDYTGYYDGETACSVEFTPNYEPYYDDNGVNIGKAEFYHDGSYDGTYQIYECEELGSLNPDKYERIYVFFTDDGPLYFCFWKENNNMLIDYRNADMIFDTLKMIEHYEE